MHGTCFKLNQKIYVNQKETFFPFVRPITNKNATLKMTHIPSDPNARYVPLRPVEQVVVCTVHYTRRAISQAFPASKLMPQLNFIKMDTTNSAFNPEADSDGKQLEVNALYLYEHGILRQQQHL